MAGHGSVPTSGDVGEASRLHDTSPYILIIDDYADNRLLLQEYLEWIGYRVCVAGSGEEGLAQIEQSIPAVVLMDMSMPGLDGYEATRRIRQMAGCERVPVVALTGRTRPEETARCFEAGCDEFLAKPFEPEQLLRIVQRYLERPGAASDSRCGSSA